MKETLGLILIFTAFITFFVYLFTNEYDNFIEKISIWSISEVIMILLVLGFSMLD